MNQRSVGRLMLTAVAGLGIAGAVALPALGDDTGAGSTATPPPNLSPAPCESLLRIDDFVMWDSIGGGVAEVPVHAGLPCTQPRTITYRVYDITATSGQDYLGVQQGTTVIAAGATSTTIRIEILGDAVAEQNEQFGIELVSGASFSDATSTVTIRD